MLENEIFKFFEDFPRIDLKLQERLIDSIDLFKFNLDIILNNNEIQDYVKEEFKRRFN
jgi:hypothetical protein